MKSLRMLLLTFLLLLTAAVPAWAFSDTQSDENAAKIDSLKDAGIISGEPGGKFNPQGSLSYASGVSAIVKGLKLNLDGYKFIRPPKASDSFPNVKDDAWYSNAFVIASVNGLGIPKNVQPNQAMSREVFAHLLSQAINKTGIYPTILKFTEIKDGPSITPAYSSSIQHLLGIGISLLDKDGNFLPKKAISRSTSAGWLFDSIEYVNKMKESENVPVPGKDPLSQYSVSTVKINDKISEVTITAQAPTPGYSLKISSIQFKGDQAVIYTTVTKPDPGKIVAQVITEVKVTTYISSAFAPVLGNASAKSGVK
ncbi:S-layer homology domain-containing protein [Paenibacillus caui]|uniref:S-layer homology domain-containing protein n=1 Tax=Paenibacillus caui TaxID=2873927 RepID=UPI001CA84ABA|nr:S-layer homology domain-containing protein [Paenibacillus caui]